MDVEVCDATAAAREILELPTWTCSDGHEHERPEEFTHNRLVREVMVKHPLRWYSSAVSLAVRRLVDDGTLIQDKRFRLRRAT